MKNSQAGNKPGIALNPTMKDSPTFGKVADRVYKAGIARIQKLEALDSLYRSAIGKGDPEITKKIAMEKRLLDSKLADLGCHHQKVQTILDLSDSENRILAFFDEGLHENDELFQMTKDRDTRLKLAMRTMSEDEYFSHVFPDLPQEKGGPESATEDGSGRQESPGALAVVDEKQGCIVTTHDYAIKKASMIASMVGLEKFEILDIIERYSEHKGIAMGKIANEMSVPLHMLIAAEINLQLDGVGSSVPVITGKPEDVTIAMFTDSRIELAVRICSMLESMAETITGAFGKANERNMKKRREIYEKRLTNLRRKVHMRNGPGNEEKAEEEYRTEAKRIHMPVFVEWNPTISHRSMLEISRLFNHNTETIARFMDYLEDSFDCDPQEDDRGSKSRLMRQLTDYHGISFSDAARMIRSMGYEIGPEEDGYNPLAGRLYRHLTSSLQRFVLDHGSELDLNASSKHYKYVEPFLMRDADEDGPFFGQGPDDVATPEQEG